MSKKHAVVKPATWQTPTGDTVKVWKSGELWYWHSQAANGEIVAQGQGYTRRHNAIEAAERGFPPAAPHDIVDHSSPLLQRLLNRTVINPLTGCWEWQGAVNNQRSRYGRIRVDTRNVPVHRAAYELFYGPVAPELQIDHLCRNTVCWAPTHLEAVPPRTNTLRGVGISAVNARKTHCINGHEFTPENTKRVGERTRACRTCAREVDRRRRARGGAA